MKEIIIVYGGNIWSQNDNQRHYIHAHDVAKLYGLKKGEYSIDDTHGLQFEVCHKLWPDSSGRYRLNPAVLELLTKIRMGKND